MRYNSINRTLEEHSYNMEYLQNHCLNNDYFIGDLFIKFSYDKKDENKFSFTKFEYEYKKGEVIYDYSPFNMLSFSSIDNLDCILNSCCSPKLYGNKLVLLKLVKDGLYYKDLNHYRGNKLFVKDSLYLYDIKAWELLKSYDKQIINKHFCMIINYINSLILIDTNNSTKYKEVIRQIEKLK